MAKLLLIEDEPDQSQMIKIRLETRGYQVITAHKAEEGIKLAQEEKPDLILMDMVLPGMHGLEATMKLKEIPETKEIPIIALTAMSIPGFRQACFKEGICSFIGKPYEPEKLLEEVEKNLNDKHKKFDEIEGVKEKVEDTLSDSDIDVQKEDRTGIKKERGEERIGDEIERKLEDILSEFGLKHEKKAPFEPAEGKIKEEKFVREEPPIEKIIEEEKIIREEPTVVKFKEERTLREEKERIKIPKKILIVDDDPDLVKMLGIRLVTCGYDVVVASDAINAVKRAHQERPDLILLDIMLPGGGGEGVFENLKISLNTMLIPVIFISAKFSPKELEEKAHQLGAEGAIPKPFESEELIAKIKEILGE